MKQVCSSGENFNTETWVVRSLVYPEDYERERDNLIDTMLKSLARKFLETGCVKVQEYFLSCSDQKEIKLIMETRICDMDKYNKYMESLKDE